MIPFFFYKPWAFPNLNEYKKKKFLFHILHICKTNFFNFYCQELFGPFVFIRVTGGSTKYASVILVAALFCLLENWEVV